MKSRMCFVSNSSSSSFIIGIAEIVDKAKFDAYLEKNKIELDEWDKYIITELSDHHDLTIDDDKLTIENFETTVSVDRKKPGTIFFVVNISNDEGDTSFWNNDYCEMDYDIELDYFCDSQRKLYDAFSDADSGLNMDNRITYGAARHG